MPYPNITTSYTVPIDFQTRYLASHLTGIHTDIDAIIAAVANPQQVVVVAKARGDYTSLSSAVAAITDATVSKPYCISLKPGIYETSEVTLPDYVSLVGLDPKSCILKASTPTSDNADYVVQAGDESVISNIGVINDCDISSDDDPECVRIVDKTVEIYNCILEATVSYTSGGINRVQALYIVGNSTVHIWNSRIEINVSSVFGEFDEASCIYIAGLTPTVYVYQCDIRVTAGPDTFSYAVYQPGNDSVLYANNSVFNSVVYPYFIGPSTATGVFEKCTLEATDNDSYAVAIGSNNVTLYDCTIRSNGSATPCIDTPGGVSFNIRVAHCRMNRAAPIDASLTNLIGTPYNVSDTDV